MEENTYNKVISFFESDYAEVKPSSYYDNSIEYNIYDNKKYEIEARAKVLKTGDSFNFDSTVYFGGAGGISLFFMNCKDKNKKTPSLLKSAFRCVKNIDTICKLGIIYKMLSKNNSIQFFLRDSCLVIHNNTSMILDKRKILDVSFDISLKKNEVTITQRYNFSCFTIDIETLLSFLDSNPNCEAPWYQLSDVDYEKLVNYISDNVKFLSMYSKPVKEAFYMDIQSTNS